MRCLECRQPLSAFNWAWRSSEPFCSDAHKVAYQAETNRLMLNRLLESKRRYARPRLGAFVLQPMLEAMEPSAPPLPVIAPLCRGITAADALIRLTQLYNPAPLRSVQVSRVQPRATMTVCRSPLMWKSIFGPQILSATS